MAVIIDVRARLNNVQRQLRDVNRRLAAMSATSKAASAGLSRLSVVAGIARAQFTRFTTTLKIFGALIGTVLLALGAGFIATVVSIGREVEQLEIQLKSIFGTIEGTRAFTVINEFVASVPFGLREVQKAAGVLGTVAKDAEDLGKILLITANVAAQTGLSFEIAATQIQRSFSAGIAAADVFREKGVRSFLGFSAGAMVSVEETIAAFERVYGPGGRFGSIANELATTNAGTLSQLTDQYDKFTLAISRPLFETLTKQFEELRLVLVANQKQIEDFAQVVAEKLVKGLRVIVDVSKTVYNNLSLIYKLLVAYIGLKIVTTLIGFGVALGQLAKFLRLAAAAQWLLNIALTANPVGLIVTAFATLTLGMIAFLDVLEPVRKAINDFFKGAISLARSFWNWLKDITLILQGQDPVLKKQVSYAKARSDFQAMVVKGEREFLEALIETEKFTRKANNNATIAAQDLADQKREGENEADKFKRKSNANAENAIEKQVALQRTYADILLESGIYAKGISGSLGKTFTDQLREGNSILGSIRESLKSTLQFVSDTIIKKSIELGIERLFEALDKKRVANKRLQNALDLRSLAITKAKAAYNTVASFFGFGGSPTNVGNPLGYAQGGIVPGGAPYTDRVPALLTPGERVIPRNEVNNSGGNTYNYITEVTQRLSTENLNEAVVEAVQVNAQSINSILESQRSR